MLILKAGIKIGWTSWFLNSSCLLMKAAVFKVRCSHSEYKGELLEVSYISYYFLINTIFYFYYKKLK